jgi:TetR/AcrR family transcriptional repressor of multidrug resistance operon
MRPRDENKIDQLREKAIETIARKGIEGLSMQKLAKDAGVSPATIYIYFKNREDMLGQLYLLVEHTFTKAMLKGFDPEMSFREGLWLQWKNRLRFVEKHPHYQKFFEQFTTSPCGPDERSQMLEFKKAMRTFVLRAQERGEIVKLQPELFWSIAYGPFYSLLRFHTGEKVMMNKDFRLTETSMRKVFACVLAALEPR